MRTITTLALLAALTACSPAATDDAAAPTSTATSSKPLASFTAPGSALEVIALSEEAGLTCPGDWQAAEGFDAGPVPLAGASETWRCGTWHDDDNVADDEWYTVAMFETTDAMETVLREAEQPVFVGDRWIMMGDDVEQLGKVAGGRMRDD